MGERISFKRRGDILRGKIRVGWIDRIESDDGIHIGWKLRFTPASGLAVEPEWFDFLQKAKARAMEHLS